MSIYDRSDYKKSYYNNKKPFTPPQRGGAGFTPKKPVRSFRDLDVYQKTMECAVIITKNIKPFLVKAKYEFMENMANCSLSVPLYIGEAHSIRFADFAAGVAGLEKAMASSNKMIVYLEYIKGVYGAKVDAELIDDIIGRYAESRTKMFHLEKSWKRFKENNPEGKYSQAGQAPRY